MLLNIVLVIVCLVVAEYTFAVKLSFMFLVLVYLLPQNYSFIVICVVLFYPNYLPSKFNHTEIKLKESKASNNDTSQN
ncbi:MAG TPA: hypothetical protein GX710_00690 [Clostridiales bacterium]|nr:hypothetical protein [Clostridiales bacterium]